MANAIEYGLIAAGIAVGIVTTSHVIRALQDPPQHQPPTSRVDWCAPFGMQGNKCLNALIEMPDGTVYRVSLGTGEYDLGPSYAADRLSNQRLVLPADPDYPRLAVKFTGQASRGN